MKKPSHNLMCEGFFNKLPIYFQVIFNNQDIIVGSQATLLQVHRLQRI